MVRVSPGEPGGHKAAIELEFDAMPRRPLWTCPRCSRRFVTKNLWHSCARVPLAHHFRGRDPRVRRLFDAYLNAVRCNGPVTVAPNRTRIAFMVRVRFAGCTVLKDHLRCTLWLRRRIADSCFEKVEAFPPSNFIHTFRLRTTRNLTSTLKRYLAEAYRVGRQECLGSTAGARTKVSPRTGRRKRP